MYAASALRQYQKVNVQSQVMDASPHRLIQLLMEGGLTRLAQARGAMERGDVPGKGEAIGKAVAIIIGLREALNMEEGGELATNLNRLYEYMGRRLTEANRKNDPLLIEEVSNLLKELKAGWDGIAQPELAAAGA